MRVSQSELKAVAERLAAKIEHAEPGVEYFDEPYKHVVIDDALTPDLAEACLKAFPSIDQPGWEHANDEDIEVKYRTTWKSEFDIPEAIVDAVRVMNSALFLKAMEARLGILKPVPDPYFSGGGLNVTMHGGLLDVHVDGNYHDATGLNRRANAILYLNPDWQPEWGGEFGVYDNAGETCVKRVPPTFNRLVIFDSHDYSFHGLPDPIRFPPGEPRRSIILYYYTKDPRPASQIAEEKPHSALWRKRGFTDKRGSKTRAFT
jgi:Rps23 Pro-64 3,4-dihydroxylase Tpa1-like proline 4-hydroxylase